MYQKIAVLPGAHEMEPPSPLISWVNPFPSRFINRAACFPRKVSYFRKPRMSRWKIRLDEVELRRPSFVLFAILQLLGSGYHEVKVNELPDWDWAWSDGTKAANWGSLACVASVSNRVIRESYWERKQKKGWRGMGRGEEETFVPLPLPRHSFFFCSCPSFLDEPREETLATQARGSRKGYLREYFFSFLPPYIPHLSMHL